MRWKIAIAAVSIGLAATAGIGISAATSSPSSPTVFYACKAKSGAVSGITTSSKLVCAPRHSRVSWNSVGPQGRQGMPGQPGAQGPGEQTYSAPLISVPSGGVGATFVIPLSSGWWTVDGYVINAIGGCTLTESSDAQTHIGNSIDGPDGGMLGGMVLIQPGGGSITIGCGGNVDAGHENRGFVNVTPTDLMTTL